MNFCSKCGNEINNQNNFCSICGERIKHKENKIDNSVENIKKNINSIKNEIDSSNTIKEFKSDLRNNFNKIYNVSINLFGIIGLVIVITQILSFIFLNKFFILKESYEKYFHDIIFMNNFERIASFIEINLIPTILPFFFMFKSGLKKRWLFNLSIALAFVMLVLFFKDNNSKNNILQTQSSSDTLSVKQKNDINNEKNNILSEENINNIEDIDDNIKFNGSFYYKQTNYNYQFNCDASSYGYCNLEITKNSQLIYSKEIINSAGLISNIKFEDDFFYFESEVGGGSSGDYYIYYSVLDIKNLKLYQLESYCPDGDSNECKFQNTQEIKNNDKVYSFFKEKFKI